MLIHVVEDLPQLDHVLVLWKGERDGLQALRLGGYETRQDAVLGLLDEADRSGTIAPFGPLLVHTLDRPVSTVEDGWQSYAFCTAPGYADVAVPDFVFGGWPEVGIDDYDQTCRAVAAAGARPAQQPVVGWIGSVPMHPARSVLHELGHQHPDLLDVQQVEWVRAPSEGRLQTSAGNARTRSEQVARWGALLDVEGKGYSGRLKLLLHSGRPLLVQDRPWTEWFWDSLVPMEYYVPVRRDLSDLVDRARWVQDNADAAAKIGQAGQELAQRQLTRAAAVEQWARTLSRAAQAPQQAWAAPALRDALEPVLRRLGVG